MHEILYHLPASARVLDLASGGGSFDAASFPFQTVRADLDLKATGPAYSFVRADARALPFESGAFDAVICNHGLEHFYNPNVALAEIGRVTRRDGAIFIAVPDASTLHDRIYRFVAKGGGHVNPFTDPLELAHRIESISGLPHVATKELGASFSFLNKRNLPPGLPRRYRLASWHWEAPLVLMSAVLRLMDRAVGTRGSVYGWAFYLGRIPEAVDTRPWTNLCMRCGQAHEPAWLDHTGSRFRKWMVMPAYRCPGCGATNFYRDDP